MRMRIGWISSRANFFFVIKSYSSPYVTKTKTNNLSSYIVQPNSDNVVNMKPILAYIFPYLTVVAAFTPLKTHSRWNGGRSSSCTFASKYDFALLFDCDGVILETEELHRLAYNEAFKAADLTIDGEPVEWSVEYYDVLQNSVGGGKPKMFFHFRETMDGKFPMSGDKPAPSTPEEQQALIDSLQEHKTQIYRDFVQEKATPRPGIIQLMDEALEDPTIAVGVCSASTKEAAQKGTLRSKVVSMLCLCCTHRLWRSSLICHPW